MLIIIFHQPPSLYPLLVRAAAVNHLGPFIHILPLFPLQKTPQRSIFFLISAWIMFIADKTFPYLFVVLSDIPAGSEKSKSRSVINHVGGRTHIDIWSPSELAVPSAHSPVTACYHQFRTGFLILHVHLVNSNQSDCTARMTLMLHLSVTKTPWNMAIKHCFITFETRIQLRTARSCHRRWLLFGFSETQEEHKGDILYVFMCSVYVT